MQTSSQEHQHNNYNQQKKTLSKISTHVRSTIMRIPASNQKIKEIQQETAKDYTLQQLLNPRSLHATKTYFRESNRGCEGQQKWFQTMDNNKFKQFSKQWEFKHTTLSLYYPQYNGLESSVKIVKHTIKKALASNQEVKHSLLILRNSALKNGHRPVKLLMGRRMHNILHAYTMPPDDTLTRDIRKEHQIQKHYFDQNHHTTNHHTKEQNRKGTITSKVASQSHNIQIIEWNNNSSKYQGILTRWRWKNLNQQ